jgi:hypothetical protein
VSVRGKQQQNFVAPYAPGEARGEIVRYEPMLPTEVLPPAAQTLAEVSGSHADRARGFQIVSVPLALGVGLGSLIVGIVGWQVPVFSVAALAWLWTGFLLTWLAAWVVHNLVSPDGIALLHTLMGWQYLKAEQRERHRRYRGQP